MEISYDPRSRIEVSLDYPDERTALSIAQAVSLDNLDAPDHVKVETVVRGSCVVTIVQGERSLETIISTIEDLLSCAQAAEKAVESIRSRT